MQRVGEFRIRRTSASISSIFQAARTEAPMRSRTASVERNAGFSDQGLVALRSVDERNDVEAPHAGCETPL
jgi:hypothetical protein